MRFMMIVLPKSYDIEPEPELFGAMDRYNLKLLKAGILRSMEGLHPPEKGFRVSFKNGKPIVKDGPFTEAKEIVGGYWLIDVKSRAEALKWAKQIPGNENMIVEVRQAEDFENFSPEIQAAAKNEPAIRGALEKKSKTAKKTRKKK
jgi:hypothetical protein